MNVRPLRVATLITRLEGGAGVLALRGATALDPDEFQVTIITGSGNQLLDQAAAAGLEVIVEPALRTPVDPRSDLRALRALTVLLRRGRFDVAHTHTAKAGALGRVAARRASVPRIVHTYHGFPFHEFQSCGRRGAYVAVERRLGRITDVALCVGTGVAVEAVRRGLIAPNRVRTIGVAVDNAPGAELHARAPEARERARRALGLPADAAVVGAVGRLTYQKAPEDFLAAMRQLGRPDVIGVWVGGGELAAHISRLASRQPTARVVLAGERADVPDDTAGVRRIRAAEPLRGIADGGGGGHGVRDPGRGYRGERGIRRCGSWPDRAPGTAAASRPHGGRRALPARPARRRRAHGGYRPSPAWRPVRRAGAT